MAKKRKRAQFDVVFAVDCETSGLNYKSDNITNNYQSVSWGIIAADAETFETIDKLYVEIKHDKSKYMWDYKAEKVHGLTRDYLEENGLSEEEAAAEIGEFILDHTGSVDEPIVLLGHNVATFDLLFLKKLLKGNGLPFKFAHRSLDSFSLSMATVKEYNSDDLFHAFGLGERGDHNALEDAENALEVFRQVNLIWKKLINGE